MSLAMSRVEREQFLAAQRVGIVSVVDPGRGPLTLPIWYAYEPGGEVRFLTGASVTQGGADPASRTRQLVRAKRDAAIPVRQRRGAGDDRGA